MITVTIIVASVFFLLGVVVVLHAAARAPEGMEGERGFQVVMAPAAQATPVLRTGASERAWIEGAMIAHSSTRAPHDPVGAC